MCAQVVFAHQLRHHPSIAAIEEVFYDLRPPRLSHAVLYLHNSNFYIGVTAKCGKMMQIDRKELCFMAGLPSCPLVSY